METVVLLPGEISDDALEVFCGPFESKILNEPPYPMLAKVARELLDARRSLAEIRAKVLAYKVVSMIGDEPYIFENTWRAVEAAKGACRNMKVPGNKIVAALVPLDALGGKGGE